jgi:Leucine-rich repeat (LRR) protein
VRSLRVLILLPNLKHEALFPQGLRAFLEKNIFCHKSFKRNIMDEVTEDMYGYIEEKNFIEQSKAFTEFRRKQVLRKSYLSDIIEKTLQTGNDEISITLVKELFPYFNKILVFKNKIKKINIEILDTWSFPIFLQEFEELEELFIRGASFYDNTEVLFTDTLKFNKLKKLTIESVHFTKENSIKIDIPTLRNIKINHCNLNQEHNFILNTKSIKNIDLNHNKFISVPDWIIEIKALLFLNIGNNEISHLPENFGDLSNLVNLKISNNNLKQLPNSFANLQKIKVLDLSYNDFVDFPDYISLLPKLNKFLKVRNPLKKDSPYRLYSLSGVQRLLIKNEKEKIRVEIFEIEEELRTAFLRYFSFFDDYIKFAKGKNIHFIVKKHSQGLELEVELSKELNLEEIKSYIKEYTDYIITESVDVVKNITIKKLELEIKLLENQIHTLKRDFETQLEMVNMRKEIEKHKDISKIQEEYQKKTFEIIKDLTTRSFNTTQNISLDNSVKNNLSSKQNFTINVNIYQQVSEICDILEEANLMNDSLREEAEEIINEANEGKSKKTITEKFKSFFKKATNTLKDTKAWLIDAPVLYKMIIEKINQIPDTVINKQQLINHLKEIFDNLITNI